MDNIQLAAFLLHCKPAEVESAALDSDGFLHVNHHGTYKRFTPAAIAKAEEDQGKVTFKPAAKPDEQPTPKVRRRERPEP